MKLHPMMPYALDQNLGRAYNEAMARLAEEDWACFLDHDAMWTTREWYRQIDEAIRFKPEAGAFTAMTNRIYSGWQRIGDKDNHDMVYHREFGRQRLKTRTLLDVTDTKGMGGVVICISKAAWRKVGEFVDGMLCVDHQMHFALRAAGLKVWLIEGLYVYHWRRANGDKLPANTPKAIGCTCHRMPDVVPRHREMLP